MHGDGCLCGDCQRGLGGGPLAGFNFEWPTTWTLGDLSTLGLVVLAGIAVYKEFFAKGRR
ncbi:MAG: hypothetical protein L0214_07550 [candidate division NC10 bacterium]|nr:hypothetical protein [candidate division NC10 bacterium]